MLNAERSLSVWQISKPDKRGILMSKAFNKVKAADHLAQMLGEPE